MNAPGNRWWISWRKFSPKFSPIAFARGEYSRLFSYQPTPDQINAFDRVLLKIKYFLFAVRLQNIVSEQIPFPDQSFDTVICTHVLEHILDYRAAIAELRRITKKRLIIVVPREREGIYTFNPHFNFFPYPHSFLRAMIPLPEKSSVKMIGRDIYYTEDRSSAESPLFH